MATYKTFIRSATNFEEFASARKQTVQKGIRTEQEARELCRAFNNNRTPRQIKLGTKMEYTEE